MQVAIEYLDGQTFEDGRTMNLPGCHADANDMRELLSTSKDSKCGNMRGSQFFQWTKADTPKKIFVY